jgi:glycosyltransferase involved in cell wall biosynthesis
MKILTFTSLFPNHAQPVLGVFVYQRVAHFARRPGNSVEVVAPLPYFPKWLRGRKWSHFGQIPQEENIGELHVLHPRYPLLPSVVMPLHGVLMSLGAIASVWRLHRETGFQVIDSHFVYPEGLAAVLLGKVLGIPVVCSARGTDLEVYPRYRLIRPQIRWALSQAAGIIAVSASLKQRMVELGISADKIQVIGNGLDLHRFGPMDRPRAREILGLSAVGPLLVSVGSLHTYKGHHLLIAAVAQIVPHYRNLKLYIVGEGPAREMLESLIRRENLQNHVFLRGTLPNEELKLWYNAADLCCLASTREGWPNVLLEAIGCGTPVLATRVGGVPEVITQSDVGLIVEPNSASIAEGLESALGKSWDRSKLTQFAQKRTWDDVAGEMEKVFLESLSSSSKT